MKKYDYIIAGGGLAGLSLAYYLSKSPLRDRSILIIDKDAKTSNDRTWCFWEQGTGPFEPILFQVWDSVDFYSDTFSGALDLGAYRYKMLRGIDFYQHIAQTLAAFPNIERVEATINRIADTPQGGFVIADDQPYIADFVFDSTYPLQLNLPQHHNLLQHFKGWVIKTEKPCFTALQPRMMDFRIEQLGECRFMYILPFDAQTALVEYTLFSPHLLSETDYDNALRQYISQFLDTGAYQIQEIEFGVIPMSDEPTTENPSEHIVRIGTAGGYTKSSTGYTFQRTQRYTQQLVQALVTTGKPIRPETWLNKAFKTLLDSVLLNVLTYHRHPAGDIFSRLYKRSPASRVLKFLDEDTTLIEDLQIAATVPLGPFLVGAVHVAWKRVFS